MSLHNLERKPKNGANVSFCLTTAYWTSGPGFFSAVFSVIFVILQLSFSKGLALYQLRADRRLHIQLRWFEICKKPTVLVNLKVLQKRLFR